MIACHSHTKMASHRQENEFAFHYRCGARTSLSSDRRIATRKDPSSCYDGALAVSDRSLKVNEYFEIRLDTVRTDKWTGSLAFGVLKGKLEKLDLLSVDSISDIPTNRARLWFLTESDIQGNNGKVLKQYGLNIESVSQGSRVGMLINKDRELHFYLNGKDCGCAVENVPSKVYAIVDVYAQCYSVSIVPRAKQSVQSVPCENDEKESSDEQDDDNVEDSIIPQGYKDFDHQVLGMDFTAQQLPLNTSKTGTARSSPHVPEVVDFKGQVFPQEEFGSKHTASVNTGKTKLAKSVPDVVDFTHQVLTDVNVGVKNAVKKDVADQGDHSRFVPDRTDFSTQSMDRVGGSNPAKSPKKWSKKKSSSGQMQSSSPPLGSRVRFSRHCGENIVLSKDGLTASRVKGYNHGVVLSEGKVPNDKVFEVTIVKMDPHWDGTISIGVTAVPPHVACRYPSAADINEGKNKTFVHYEDCLYKDGEELKDLEVNLINCRQGEVIGVFCSRDSRYDTDTLYLVRDKKVIKKIAIKVPKERYVIVDIYGQCTCVKLMPLRDAPQFKKSKNVIKQLPETTVPNPSHSEELKIKRKPPEDVSRPQRDCPYKELCKRYLNSLNLPEALLDPTPGYNKCFCLECHEWRRDEEVYSRGNPPQVYALPLGWCRFALQTPPRAQSVNAFKDYHIGFHGTRAVHVRTILDSGTLLLPGDVALGGEVISPPKEHFSEDMKPEGYDVNRIFLSPSIKYAGCSAYSKPERFEDTVDSKIYDAKVAFQVLIRPGSYDISEETVGATGKGIPVDSHFSNEKLEWSTKEKVATILYGLLVELRQKFMEVDSAK